MTTSIQALQIQISIHLSFKGKTILRAQVVIQKVFHSLNKPLNKTCFVEFTRWLNEQALEEDRERVKGVRS